MRAGATSRPHLLASLATSALATLALTLSGCRGCDAAPRELPASAATASAEVPPPEAPRAQELIQLADELPGCDVEHRGLLFDWSALNLPGRMTWGGSPTEAKPHPFEDQPRSAFLQAPLHSGVLAVEHAGSTWARISERQIKITFVLPEASPVFVSMRVIGLASRVATISLDDFVLGTVRLQRDQIRIASTNTTTLPLDRGLHTVTVRFSGRSVDKQAFADVDWIRVGTPDELPSAYGAPTRRDLIAAGAALGGVPHRSISLRAPGAVRCPVRPARTTRLRASVGMLGPGEGDADIRVIEDGKEPILLHQLHVTGTDKATWTEVDIPLDPFAGRVVSLELRAVRSTRGGRILFGDAALIGPPEPPPTVPRARAVVVVALNGVERQDLPPWSGRADPRLPTLSELGSTAATFDRHRAPSTITASVIGSLLTGVPPQAHALVDLGSRLSERMTTLNAVARDSSIRTAMFTGVPMSFGAFGFGSAWGTFFEHPPASGDAATTPIDRATAWVTDVARENKSVRLFAFIHARGGHPPWQVSAKELGALKPVDYAGPIEPRRAGQVMARVRASRRRNKALGPNDHDRIRDLSAIALGEQDRAVGALIGALKSAGLWDETLFIVTGDVSSGPSSEALFGDAVDLAEAPLTLPLYVHFPDDLYGGRRVGAPTEVVDIFSTAFSALGLGAMPGRRVYGRDLTSVASGLEGVGRDPQVAVLGERYSSRWGDLVLYGRFGSAPFLCDLSLDPTCAFNRRDMMPLAAMMLFRKTLAFDTSARASAPQREPATVDADTSAQLSVWGAP
ncbi:sulfatase-like hydrolase/transferase [Chondromyces crocatus]|uniref:Sulfatase N-terminal domain-containing protein n=1 Tax=Chondromyces crocatus TaxID=52 RepID=A0A0K1E6A4_CHOCO|nr:sulfatase-like hydrolase/transferase [Chondromyces crocatus]AKT36410.1 uncharacterized protein CMC5_005230 [Chondromyces crocatus]